MNVGAEYYAAPKHLASVIDRLGYISGYPMRYIEPHFGFNPEALLWGVGALIAFWLAYLYISVNQHNTRAGEEHGSSRWGTAEDIKPFIDWDHPENNILMTATERLYQTDPDYTRTPMYSRNAFTAVVGAAGTGKTRTVVIPNLMQANSSYVVTDTKSATRRATVKYFRSKGYVIKTLDFITRENTDHFNVFHYIKNEDDIIEMVDVFMANTSDDKKTGGDAFFDKAERLLFSALIDYLRLMIRKEDQSMASVAKMVRLLETTEDGPGVVSPLDVMFEEFAERFPDAFGVKEYETYKVAPGKTSASMAISAGVRLAPFDVPSLARMTSDDTLDLDLVGDQKTIVYLVLPDQTSTYNFLIGMTYQVLFSKLVERADQVYGGHLPVPVLMVMDEFANTAKIPNFDARVNTVRSRGIGAMIFLQNIPQIKQGYPKSWDSIMGAADSFLFLGGNDDVTAKYVSDRMGQETIEVLNTSTTRGAQGSFNTRYDKIARPLMQPAEVSRMRGDESIYILRGVQPFKSKRIVVEKLPTYKAFKAAQDAPDEPVVKQEKHKNTVEEFFGGDF